MKIQRVILSNMKQKNIKAYSDNNININIKDKDLFEPC